jgi:hypothetical protein
MLNVSILPIWAKILIIAALFGIIFGSGCYAGGKWVRADWDAEKVATLQAEAKLAKETQERYDDVSSKLQAALQSTTTTERVIDRGVIREVQKPVYTACIVPETGVILLNDATKKLNAERVGPLP